MYDPAVTQYERRYKDPYQLRKTFKGMYDKEGAITKPDPEMLRRHRAATQSSLELKKVNLENANLRLVSITGGVKDQKLGQGSPINKMK